MLPVEKAIAGLQGAIERLEVASKSERIATATLVRDGVMRQNVSYVHEYNTADGESDALDVVRELGAPASGLRVWSVGAGTLQISINGGKWLPVVVGDEINNDTMRTARFRCTTPGAGQAVVRFTGYVPQ